MTLSIRNTFLFFLGLAAVIAALSFYAIKRLHERELREAAEAGAAIEVIEQRPAVRDARRI